MDSPSGGDGFIISIREIIFRTANSPNRIMPELMARSLVFYPFCIFVTFFLGLFRFAAEVKVGQGDQRRAHD